MVDFITLLLQQFHLRAQTVNSFHYKGRARAILMLMLPIDHKHYPTKKSFRNAFLAAISH